jgi:hypothetical protein
MRGRREVASLTSVGRGNLITVSPVWMPLEHMFHH